VNTSNIETAIKIAAILADSTAQPQQSDNRPVIVRSRDAGCLYGYLDKIDGSTVTLTRGRQMWSWTAAQGGTLIDCATHGVKAGKFSVMGGPVTIINACAVIDVKPEASLSLEDAKWA
jgi:hypothetical protein